MLGASFVIWLLFKTASSVPVTIFSMINDEEMLYSQFIHLSFIHLFLNGKLTGKGRPSVNHWVGLIWDCTGYPLFTPPNVNAEQCFVFKHLCLYLYPLKMPMSTHPLFWSRVVWMPSYWTARWQISTSSRVWHSFPPQLRNQILCIGQALDRVLCPL